jgi:hypothetical protein
VAFKKPKHSHLNQVAEWFSKSLPVTSKLGFVPGGRLDWGLKRRDGSY